MKGAVALRLKSKIKKKLQIKKEIYQCHNTYEYSNVRG
jgi:hypothetical protein